MTPTAHFYAVGVISLAAVSGDSIPSLMWQSVCLTQEGSQSSLLNPASQGATSGSGSAARSDSADPRVAATPSDHPSSNWGQPSQAFC